MIPPGDVGALGTAIARLLQDHAERSALGRQARATAERTFSAPAAAASLVETYVSSLR
jgi:glycosyltransferase involved in cell wall biosynthesis